MDNHESYKLQYVLHYNTIVRTYVHNSAALVLEKRSACC